MQLNLGSYGRKFALSVATLVLFLLLGEGAVRLFTQTRPPLLEVDARLGRRYPRGFEGQVFNEESEREVGLRFNAQGLRFSERPFEKPAGVRRLIVMGDSFIAGLEVEEEETACAILETMLRESRPQEHWEVLNFGISGSAPDQEYVLYRELASLYQPDLVLCTYFVGNDFAGLSTQLSSWTKIYFELDETGSLRQLPYPAPRDRFNALLNENSRLYVWQKRLFHRLRLRAARPAVASSGDGAALRRDYHGHTLRKSEWVYCNAQTPLVKETWDLTSELFTRFAGAVERDGARFGIVLMPAPEQLIDENFEFVRELAGELGDQFDVLNPNRRLAALSTDLGIDYIDLLPGLREATPAHTFSAREQWILFNGTGHLNPRGNALVARGIFEGLAQGLKAAEISDGRGKASGPGR